MKEKEESDEESDDSLDHRFDVSEECGSDEDNNGDDGDNSDTSMWEKHEKNIKRQSRGKTPHGCVRKSGDDNDEEDSEEVDFKSTGCREQRGRRGKRQKGNRGRQQYHNQEEDKDDECALKLHDFVHPMTERHRDSDRCESPPATEMKEAANQNPDKKKDSPSVTSSFPSNRQFVSLGMLGHPNVGKSTLSQWLGGEESSVHVSHTWPHPPLPG